MKRRKFVKLTSASILGVNLPFIAHANPLFAEKAIPLWLLAGWRYFKGAVEIVSTVKTAIEIINFFGDGDDCRDCRDIDTRLNHQGYTRYDDSRISYAPPTPLPDMPSTYAAFTYAKINPNGKGGNTQTFFAAKNHERKEVVQLLPETAIYALCCALQLLKNHFDLSNPSDRKKIQSILLPSKKDGHSTDSDGYESIVFTTFHGTIKFEGSMKREAESGQPKTINGTLQISPNFDEKDSNPVKELVFANKNLDFIFRANN